MIDTFFKSEADRDLWLRLNAEHQIAWEKSLTYFDKTTQTHKPTQQALNPRSMNSALQVARNQLDYDIKSGVLRYTLEDYLTLSFDELEEKGNLAHKKWIKKFESL